MTRTGMESEPVEDERRAPSVQVREVRSYSFPISGSPMHHERPASPKEVPPTPRALDRAQYFERCWPNNEMVERFTFRRILEEDGEAVAYALWKLQERGRMFVSPGDKLYEGMIIGIHSRDNDLVVNPIKGKQLTNVRASGKDDAIGRDWSGQAGGLSPEWTGKPGQDGDRHPCQNPAVRGVRSVEITVGIEPDHAQPGTGAVCLLQPGDHTDRRGVIARENERPGAGSPGGRDERSGLRTKDSNVDCRFAFNAAVGI